MGRIHWDDNDNDDEQDEIHRISMMILSVKNLLPQPTMSMGSTHRLMTLFIPTLNAEHALNKTNLNNQTEYTLRYATYLFIHIMLSIGS